MEINLSRVFEGDEHMQECLKVALTERLFEAKPLKVYWDEAGVVGESKCKQSRRKENNDWRSKGKRGFRGYQGSEFD